MPVVTRKPKPAASTVTSASMAQPALPDLKNPTVATARTSTAKAKTSSVHYKDDDPFYSAFDDAFEESDNESDVSDYGRNNTKRLKLAKMKKMRKSPKKGPGPAPEAPEISDDESNALDGDTLVYNNTSDVFTSMADGKSKSIIYVEVPGAEGPSALKLNLADLLRGIGFHLDFKGPGFGNTFTGNRIAVGRGKQKKKQASEVFFKLPWELRHKIYSYLMIAPGPINLNLRGNLKNCGQFLRTNKQIAAEGAMVLYGLNSFHLARTNEKRGTYRDLIWKDIGFKDIRRFLVDIGPINISHMKYVSFALEDATIYVTPNVDKIERQYVNDAVLHDIFNMLGARTVLRKFAISFAGRAQVNAKDLHFLRALGSIKCNDFYHAKQAYGTGKIQYASLAALKSVMVIKKEGAENIDESKVKSVPLFYSKPTKENYSF